MALGDGLQSFMTSLGVGHGSGKVGYADCLEDTHSQLLYGATVASYSAYLPVDSDHSILQIFKSAQAKANPFSSVFTAVGSLTSLHDPTTDVSAASTAWSSFHDAVVIVSPVTNVNSWISAAKTQADAIIYPVADLNDVVDSYEAQATPTFMRGLNRFNAGMADINSVVSSSFVIGYANLERQFMQDINDFRAKLNLQRVKDRDSMVMSIVDQYKARDHEYLAGLEASYRAYFDIAKARMAAYGQRESQILDINSRYITWPMELFGHCTTVLNAIAGAQMGPRPITNAAAFWGGFITGAGTFGAMGAAMGPEGAIIGALAGGVIGGFASLLGNK